MTFLQAIKTSYSTKFINLHSRATRSEMWWTILFSFIFTFLTAFVCIALTTDLFYQDGLDVLSPQACAMLIICCFIYNFIACTSVAIRRLHDLNCSGWWILIFYLGYAIVSSIQKALTESYSYNYSNMYHEPDPTLLALSGGIGLLYIIGWSIFLSRAGTKGSNRFGPNPLAPQPLKSSRELAAERAAEEARAQAEALTKPLVTIEAVTGEKTIEVEADVNKMQQPSIATIKARAEASAKAQITETRVKELLKKDHIKSHS